MTEDTTSRDFVPPIPGTDESPRRPSNGPTPKEGDMTGDTPTPDLPHPVPTEPTCGLTVKQVSKRFWFGILVGVLFGCLFTSALALWEERTSNRLIDYNAGYDTGWADASEEEDEVMAVVTSAPEVPEVAPPPEGLGGTETIGYVPAPAPVVTPAPQSGCTSENNQSWTFTVGDKTVLAAVCRTDDGDEWHACWADGVAAGSFDPNDPSSCVWMPELNSGS